VSLSGSQFTKLVLSPLSHVGIIVVSGFSRIAVFLLGHFLGLAL
jgi:hypothetical protein